MDQILQTLLTMTTTASVAALCVMGLRLLLKRAPRWITCLLWMVVFVRMVCPVSFSLPVSLVPAPIAQGTYVQQAGQALEASSRTQASAPADTGGPADQGAAAGADRTDVVVGLWGAGTLVMLLWGGVSYLRLRRRTGEAIRLEGNLYETDQIAAPFVCGVFSPKIYLPVGLDPQDRPYVLLHEQAHLRRRDHLTKPLAWLALCLHWCNPLLWLAYRLFCRDLETACDQAVIRRFGAKDTAQYAAALLHLGHSGKLPQAVPLAFGEEDPKGRIRHVLDYKRPPVWVAGIALLVCAATIVLILANPGVPEDQMEGVAITETYLQLRGTPVRLPEELQTSLVSLLRDYDQEDYTSLAQFSLPNGHRRMKKQRNLQAIRHPRIIWSIFRSRRRIRRKLRRRSRYMSRSITVRASSASASAPTS